MTRVESTMYNSLAALNSNLNTAVVAFRGSEMHKVDEQVR